MIISHSKFPIRADKVEEAQALMAEMTAASLVEDGCISYDFYSSISDPSTILLFQEWESVDAVQAHFASDHMAVFLNQLPDLLTGEVSSHRYAVQGTEAEQEMRQEYFTEEFEEDMVTVH